MNLHAIFFEYLAEERIYSQSFSALLCLYATTQLSQSVRERCEILTTSLLAIHKVDAGMTGSYHCRKLNPHFLLTGMPGRYL